MSRFDITSILLSQARREAMLMDEKIFCQWMSVWLIIWSMFTYLLICLCSDYVVSIKKHKVEACLDLRRSQVKVHCRTVSHMSIDLPIQRTLYQEEEGRQ